MRGTVLCFLALLLCSCRAIIVTPFTQCGNLCSVDDYECPSTDVEIILTGDNVVYRSTDEGQHWVPLVPANSIFVYPSDPNAMVFVKNANTAFYTTPDGGSLVIQAAFPFGGSASLIILNRQKTGWILASNCTGIPCKTWYSKDSGKSWNQGPQVFSKSLQWGISPQEPDTIFGVEPGMTFAFTKDYGKTLTPLFVNVAGFIVTDNFLFVGVLTTEGGISLYTSANRDDSRHTEKSKYLLADFPFGSTIPDQGYTFLDDSTRSEYIAVKRGDSRQWGTLYSSDFDGEYYTLSLRYVAQSNLIYDFDKVNGLDGIYLANSYPTATSTSRQTRITFDNGGAWRLLTAPSLDYYNQPIDCQQSKNCSLHLHGLVSYFSGLYPPYYSSPNAIGLIVGVGNIGDSLTNQGLLLDTYISRDAGLTWKVLYPVPTIYEFGDHGGILVFATTTEPTNLIYYSTDEGLTTSSFQFSTATVWVDNIITEPTGSGRKFILLGTSTSTTKSVIIGLDFSDSALPQCTDNDYETWSPSNGEQGANQNCFMGAVTTYSRRKQASECYNDRDTDHVISTTPCACDYLDYECDMGYDPTPRDPDTYEFSCSKDLSEEQPPCSSGYRLIPETQCLLKNGLNLLDPKCGPITSGGSHGSDDNNGKKPKSGGSTTAVVIILILILAGVGGVAAAYWKHEGFRTWVLTKFGKKNAGYSQVVVNNDEEDDLIE